MPLSPPPLGGRPGGGRHEGKASQESPHPNPPPAGEGVRLSTVTLLGRCPACGRGTLFKNLLEIADYCHACGLSFKEREQGDGPAFLGILLVGALTAIGAVIVDIKFSPPFWVHAAIWVPFVIGGSLLSLRLMKALMIGVQYRYRGEDFTL